MDKPHFVVPDHIFDNRRSVPVEDVDLEVFPQLCTQSSTAKISVARGLQADTLAIEFDGRQIGIVRSKLCPELQWLVDAGLIPIATMRFRGGQEHTAELVLPPDGRCIPANNPPAAPWTMLEGTTPIALPSPANRLIFNTHGQQQFLVTLRVKRTLTCRKVNAYIDDVFVGSLPRKQGQALAETILNLHHQGIVAVARALYTPRVASTSLTVYADSLSESRIRAIANGGVTLGTIGIATAIAARNKSHAAVLSSAPATTTALGVGTAAVASVSTVAAVVTGGAAVYETSPEVAPPSIEAAPQQDFGALPLGKTVTTQATCLSCKAHRLWTPLPPCPSAPDRLTTPRPHPTSNLQLGLWTLPARRRSSPWRTHQSTLRTTSLLRFLRPPPYLLCPPQRRRRCASVPKPQPKCR